MKILDEYLKLEKEIHAYFGYVEDWRIIPIDDAREYYWKLDGEGPGTVTFAETKYTLNSNGYTEVQDTQ